MRCECAEDIAFCGRGIVFELLNIVYPLDVALVRYILMQTDCKWSLFYSNNAPNKL